MTKPKIIYEDVEREIVENEAVETEIISVALQKKNHQPGRFRIPGEFST